MSLPKRSLQVVSSCRNVKYLFNQVRFFNDESKDIVIPEAPTTCCMSGCANCVWIEYAQELLSLFKDSNKSREIILQKVEDPNMRAFLLTELSSLKPKDEDPSGQLK